MEGVNSFSDQLSNTEKNWFRGQLSNLEKFVSNPDYHLTVEPNGYLAVEKTPTGLRALLRRFYKPENERFDQVSRALATFVQRCPPLDDSRLFDRLSGRFSKHPELAASFSWKADVWSGRVDACSISAQIERLQSQEQPHVYPSLDATAPFAPPATIAHARALRNNHEQHDVHIRCSDGVSLSAHKAICSHWENVRYREHLEYAENGAEILDFSSFSKASVDILLDFSYGIPVTTAPKDCPQLERLAGLVGDDLFLAALPAREITKQHPDKSLLLGAVMTNRIAAVMPLLKRGEHSKGELQNALFSAFSVSPESIPLLVQLGASLTEGRHCYDEGGSFLGLDTRTPLEIASIGGHDRAVEQLLALDVDVNLTHRTPSESAFPPLYLAATNGHAHIVEMLLKTNKCNLEKQPGLRSLQENANRYKPAVRQALQPYLKKLES